jgi:hypothetical protein
MSGFGGAGEHPAAATVSRPSHVAACHLNLPVICYFSFLLFFLMSEACARL